MIICKTEVLHRSSGTRQTMRPLYKHPRKGQKAPQDPATKTAALAWLRHDGRTAGLLATAHQHMDLEQHLRAALPAALQSSCHVLRFEDGQLTIGVPAAAHSAKLRQLAPRIASSLEKRGWQVNGIAVRVQATLSRPLGGVVAPNPVGRPNQIGSPGIQAFADLQDKISDGPLAQAVARLVARRRET
ncbi:DUF721 domain-containing protein [Pigmentiphaga aceris]|uniref:DUF721 domain-containing protein n=1 Tax=Pigmentiphaga aceris TaxID=1940612 RepID=A0A5C0AS60_9BURK|nr:DciA family protein [Pigmentiphaga aceris]QEI05042.1 DUF721 domain-containing protein [Pigmentiphaga aceris]